MGGHTPGPWGYEDPLGPDILSIVANPDAPPYEWLHVAQIGFTDDEDDGRSFAEHEANARLIAAAPELLEALQEYMACVALTTRPEMQGADILTLHEVAQRLDAARVGAEAAIAKATGDA